MHLNLGTFTRLHVSHPSIRQARAAALLSTLGFVLRLHALLPPPQPVYPLAGGYLDSGTALAWHAIPGAASYEVEVCADDACTHVLDRGRDLKTTYWQPRVRDLGSYYWRVRATNGETGRPVSFNIALTISGAIYDDPPALALPEHFVPVAGAIVNVYADGSGEKLASLRSDLHGRYAFHTRQSGVYWLAVDSRSVARKPAWAEQTYAPPGGICTILDASTFTREYPGPCIGGRLIGQSDDASALVTSKHVARVALKDIASDMNFAFSSNVVDTLEDFDTAERPVQGSFRQFITNANSISGPNAMRFLPRIRPHEPQIKVPIGIPPRWWTIQLKRALPPLSDPGTSIDGKAFSFAAPNTLVEPNVHRAGIHDDLKPPPLGNEVVNRRNPDLEIVSVGDEGIVCTAQCTVRGIAVNGSVSSIVVRSDAVVEHAIIGAHADSTPVEKTGTAGLQIEKGTTTAREVFVAGQTTAGIVVTAGDARLTAARVEITRCGTEQSGGAIVLLSNGSRVESSMIDQNFGAGVVLGVPTSASPVSKNTITGCTISGNVFGIVLSPGASDNQITSNVVLWNRFGGVIAAPYQAATMPVRNLIESNRFDENGGRPISFDLRIPDFRSMLEHPGCGRDPSVANGGLFPPEIRDVRLHNDHGNQTITIEGTGCPGTTVWLYQSYATSGVRSGHALAGRLHARDEASLRDETIVSRSNDPLPSIGEFNPANHQLLGADGRFLFTVPVVRTTRAQEIRGVVDNDFEMRFDDFAVVDPADTAFAAMAIDAEGNSSEIGVRHLVGHLGHF